MHFCQSSAQGAANLLEMGFRLSGIDGVELEHVEMMAEHDRDVVLMAQPDSLRQRKIPRHIAAAAVLIPSVDRQQGDINAVRLKPLIQARIGQASPE